MVAAFAVDRLGRSLPDLVAFLSDIQARGCDLYLHQQAVDTLTPSGRMLFQMLAVFAEFERSIITSRINAGLARARANGVQFGRPNLSLECRTKVQKALRNGLSIRQAAKATGVSTASVQRIKRSMSTVQEAVLERPSQHDRRRRQAGQSTCPIHRSFRARHFPCKLKNITHCRLARAHRVWCTCGLSAHGLPGGH